MSNEKYEWGCYACKKRFLVDKILTLQQCPNCKKSYIEYDRTDGIVSNLYCKEKWKENPNLGDYLGACQLCGFMKLGRDPCPECENTTEFVRVFNIKEMDIWYNIHYARIQRHLTFLKYGSILTTTKKAPNKKGSRKEKKIIIGEDLYGNPYLLDSSKKRKREEVQEPNKKRKTM